MMHEKGKMDYGSSRMSWGGIICIMLMQHGIHSRRDDEVNTVKAVGDGSDR